MNIQAAYRRRQAVVRGRWDRHVVAAGKAAPPENAGTKSKSGAKRESAAITARWQWQSTAGVARRNANAGKTQQAHACRVGMHAAGSVPTALRRPRPQPAGEAGRHGRWGASRPASYLFLSLPRGITEVTGAMGRSEGLPVLGAEVSFLGFLDNFSLRCSLAINSPDIVLK